MKNQGEINDPLFFKMLLENLEEIVKEMGVGTLYIDYLNKNKVAHHLSLADYSNPMKVPVLTGSFHLPDGRGSLLSFNMGINETIIQKRDLDQEETFLFGDILSQKFGTESIISIFNYFYVAVTFISYHSSRKDIENKISSAELELKKLKGKEEPDTVSIDGAATRLKRLEDILEKFNEKFSEYLLL